MRLPEFRELFFPLVLATFAAGGLESLGGVVLAARWGLAASLAIYLLFTSRSLKTINSLLLASLLVYVFWCICTYAWSEVPQLTLFKVIALAIVGPAMLLAGYDWAQRHDLAQIPKFMWMFLALALFAGVSNPAGFEEFGTGRQVYKGATGNPNAMGVLAAVATVPAFWYLYQYKVLKRSILAWKVAIVSLLIPLYLTNSRAGLLLFAFIFGAYLVAHGLSRNAGRIVLGLMALLAVAILLPQARDAFIQRNIYKETQVSTGIFYSRADNWRDSYNAAFKGGWLGVGYGVSADMNAFKVDVNAIGYGREKGNSQLAVIEETGVVGFLFYAGFLILVFQGLFSAFLQSGNLDAKVLLGLLIGASVGLTVQSTIEAWWGSPGSVEFALFWSVTGVALGLAKRMRRETAEHQARVEKMDLRRFRKRTA
jgi:hypothetical protein